MNEPDHELGRNVARLLDQGADQLDPQVRDKLYAARQAAMARYTVRTAPAWAPAWAGEALARVTERPVMGVRYLVPIAALILGLIGVTQWQNTGPWSEMAEIDAGLLTDELPINAFLDAGFDSWLKRSSR